MEDFFGYEVFRMVFSFIGALVRWVFGSIWRTLTRKQKYTFKDYLLGAKSSDNEINFSLGFAVLVIVAVLIAYVNY